MQVKSGWPVLGAPPVLSLSTTLQGPHFHRDARRERVGWDRVSSFTTVPGASRQNSPISESASNVAFILRLVPEGQGPLGVDPKGHVFGPAIAAATEKGVWVEYTYLNPATEEEGDKAYLGRQHEGLYFGSGWYEAAN